MEDKKEAKSHKKGIWAILKESMNKASSGCGPGCGCHVGEQDKGDQHKERSANDK